MLPRTRKEPKELPTIWRVPDDLWEQIVPVLAAHDPPKATGRKRIDQRAARDALLFRLRSGCQCHQLPSDLPDDSSVQRTFQRWVARGIFERIWALVVTTGDELGGVDWHWQAAAAALGKARMGGIRSGPIRLTVGKRACSAAGWSKPVVVRWRWWWLGRMSTIPSCSPRRWTAA